MKILVKGIKIAVRRLRTQGPRTTALWVYARGIPYITGKPFLSYSRITPEIYVGPQYKLGGKQRLEQAGIQYVVNMRVEFDDAEHGLALENYCHLPTVDDTPPSMEHLKKGIAFISDAVRGGGKVYIHCSAGVGRAPTMAAAYFLSQGHDLDEAIGMIKRVRPFINIMASQMEILQQFELSRRTGASAPAPDAPSP